MPLPTTTSIELDVGTVDPEDPLGIFYTLGRVGGGHLACDAYGKDLMRSAWANWTDEPFVEAVYSNCYGHTVFDGPINAYDVTALLDTIKTYIPASTTPPSLSVLAAPLVSTGRQQPSPTTEVVSPQPSRTSLSGETAPDGNTTPHSVEPKPDRPPVASSTDEACSDIACFVISAIGAGGTDPAGSGVSSMMSQEAAPAADSPMASVEASITASSETSQSIVQVVTLDGSVATGDDATHFPIGSETLSPGGLPVVYEGTTYSIGSSDTVVHVNDQTAYISPATLLVATSPPAGKTDASGQSATDQIQQEQSYAGSMPLSGASGANGVPAVTYEVQADKSYIVGSQTLSAGSPGVTMLGVAYTMVASGQVVASRLRQSIPSGEVLNGSEADTSAVSSTRTDLLSARPTGTFAGERPSDSVEMGATSTQGASAASDTGSRECWQKAFAGIVVTFMLALI